MYKKIAIVALIMSITGLSMAFAALSQTLTIDGSATVNISGWSLNFANLQDVVLSGSTTENRVPTLSSRSTSITNFDLTFYNQNDTATYFFDIMNSGTINALISEVLFSNPVCTGTGANKEADELLVCSNLTFTLTYVGGANDGLDVAIGDEYDSGVSKNVKLTISYDSATKPSELVEITNLGLTMLFEQN